MTIEFRSMPAFPPPRTAPGSRRSLIGKQTFAALLKRLQRELNALKASAVVIGTGHREEDIRRDGMPYANARKPTHPGVVLWFRAGTIGEDLRFACDAYHKWEDNLREIAMTLEDLRALGRRKTIQGNEQYRGWKALPEPPQSETEPPQEATQNNHNAPAREMSDEERIASIDKANFAPRVKAAAKLLVYAGEKSTIARERVSSVLLDKEIRKRVYREAIKRHHPDTGGSHITMLRLQEIWEALG